MKTTIAFSTLLASVLAQAPTYFGVMSTRSASPIHLLPLNAIGGKFFLGGTPSAYCPVESVGNETCAGLPGTETTFAGGDGTLSLAVVVPGGQQVYIAPDGTMSYTMPHSAYIPEGSVRDGWTKTEGENFGNLSFKGGLVACPGAEGKPWQVYGQIPGFTAAPACLGFSDVTVNATSAGAWEY